jgi:hypothetical protein
MSPTLGQRILSLLCLRGERMYPKQIAEALKANESSVRVTLGRLLEEAKVVYEDGLYAATDTIRKEWIERLAFGAEEAQTKYHALCYTIPKVDGAYSKTQGWPDGGIGGHQKTVEYRRRDVTFRVFPNDKVVIYVGATAHPISTTDIAEVDSLIDAILQIKFDTRLEDYQLRQIEANTDIINATLQHSAIVIRRENRLLRIYEKIIDGVPCVRIETRFSGKPMNVSDKDLTPFVTNEILYSKMLEHEEGMKYLHKEHEAQSYNIHLLKDTMKAILLKLQREDTETQPT